MNQREMIEMKKSVKAVILIAVIIAAVLIGVFHTDVYLRIYPKDRISGTYTVTLDGKPVDYRARYTSDFQEEELPCGENGTVGLKGGEYGRYTVILEPGDGAPEKLPGIRLEIFNSNWWNFVKFDLTCGIKTVGKQFEAEMGLTYSYYDVNAKQAKKTVNRTFGGVNPGERILLNADV